MSEQELNRRLRAHGFELARQNKHRVFKNPSGLTFVLPSTPSDQRWSHNALADLARLCGPSDADSRPLRARRQHGTLDPKPTAAAPVAPVELVEQPIPAPAPEPQPLSRADRVRLKRWEKHESQRGEKDVRRLAKLQVLAHQAHETLERSGRGQRGARIVRLTRDTYRRVRQLGFQDVALSAASVRRNAFSAIAVVIRVGTRFIDIIAGVVRESPTWDDEGMPVEVWADMRPDDFLEFDGEEMYIGPMFVSPSKFRLELEVPDGREAELALFYALISYAEGTPAVIFLSDGSLIHGNETLKAARDGTDPEATCTMITLDGDADEMFRVLSDSDWPELLEAARQNCADALRPSDDFLDWVRQEIEIRENETEAA
jgi:predicted RNA binding protein YcfA (HicA-like mRNA interferase family)